MKYLSKDKVENRNIILRCDFNVPVKDGKILDNSKIIKSLKTINYLLDNNNRVIILSHFGRVKSNFDKGFNSLKIVYNELKQYIDVIFIENNDNIEFYLNTSKAKCFLIENTRFTDVPTKKESQNDLELAKYWSNFADVFVIDAFASMHRVHSSTAGISKFLPTYFGFLIEEELENLSIVIKPKKPFVVIMGGAKVDDKIKIINNILNKCDKLILTGGILNTFLKVLGFNVGKSLVSENQEVLENVNYILANYKDKLVLSDKFLVLNNGKILEKSIREIENEDIILDNIISNSETIKNANTVFFNGVCGKVEDKSFINGTLKLLNLLKSSTAKVIIGGGDTLSTVNNLGMAKDFYYLSSGGGATLEYVANGSLAALDWIKDNGVEN